MKPIALTTENFVLFFILLVSAAVRIIGLQDFTYSADEISALVRTDFSTFSDVIEYGVMKRDMHPAGVQVFLYYWTSLFGYGEWIVRIPFILMGVVSVFLSYKITKTWFSKHTALNAAALITGLQYFILYSEIARPYSPGLCFVLAVVFYWDKIMFQRDTTVKQYLGFAFFCLMCLYTHYFAGIVALFVALTGFLYIDRKKLKAYLLTGAGIVVCFLPHLNITLFQMQTGGLHGWLGPPNKYWIINYLYTLFNNSCLMLVCFGIILFVALYHKIKQLTITHKHVICLAWFSLTFLFGFIYSRIASPILQPSIMLFAAPFLLFSLADLLSLPRLEKRGLIIPVAILVITLASTSIEQDYFRSTHFGVFQEISEKNLTWESKYGAIDKTINVSGKNMMDFIQKHKGLIVDYKSHTIDTEVDWDNIQSIIQNSKTDYFSHGWSTRSNPIAIYEMIKLKFPYLIENSVYENSQVALFSKSNGIIQKPKRTIELSLSEEHNRYYSNLNQSKEEHPNYGSVVHIKPNTEFALEVKIPITDLSINPDEYIRWSFEIMEPQKKGIISVYQIERDGALLKKPNGEDAWEGRNTKTFCTSDNWHQFVHARKVDLFLREGDLAKFFFWNNARTDAYIRNIKIDIMSRFDLKQ